MNAKVPNPDRLRERLSAWAQATLSKLKQRDWRIGLVVVTVAYAFLEAVRAVVSDASTLAVVWIGKGIWWLIRQPMGLGGLALLVFVAALVAVSWWQSRPKSEPKPFVKPELSDTDRQLVQDLRTIWNRHGRDAVTQLYNLMQEVTYELKERVYWGELVMPVLNELGRTTEAVTQAVAFQSEMSVKQVREQFNEMYAAYLDAISLGYSPEINSGRHRTKEPMSHHLGQ